jgi:hypothetical protein
VIGLIKLTNMEIAETRRGKAALIRPFNAFAYLAACADKELGRLAAIVDRLWRCAERRKRIDDGPFPDRRYARDINLPDEAHAVLQLDVGTDDTIRADLDAVPNAGTVGDARRRINRHVLTDPTAAWY